MEKESLLTENLLEIEMNIETNFFHKTKFLDDELEEKFIENQIPLNKMFNLFSDILVIAGYLVSLFYIVMVFYRFIFLIICLTFKILTLILIIISNKIDQQKQKILKKYLNHIQIFLLSLCLNLKSLLISLYFNNSNNDNYEEVIRIIIYEFVSTHIFILLKLDSNLLVSLSYFFMNLFTILIAEYNSNKNRYYLLEAVTSFGLCMIFYTIRKLWDIRIRMCFAEKQKFQVLFEYTNDFLVGLNGYHIIAKGDKFYSLNNSFFENLYFKENCIEKETLEIKLDKVETNIKFKNIINTYNIDNSNSS